MPKYNVSTFNVTEVIDAASPEEAASKSAYASLFDPATAVPADASPLQTVTPSAGAPEARIVPPSETVSLSGHDTVVDVGESDSAPTV